MKCEHSWLARCLVVLVFLFCSSYSFSQTSSVSDFQTRLVEALKPLAATLSPTQKLQLTKVLDLFDERSSQQLEQAKQLEDKLKLSETKLQESDSRSVTLQIQYDLLVKKQQDSENRLKTLEPRLTQLETSLNNERSAAEIRLFTVGVLATAAGWGLGLVFHF